MPSPTSGPNVGYIREEVIALRPRWDLIRDCISGQKAIKDKGSVYLPIPNAEDTSTENLTRYANYKARAVFYGVTGRTLRGLLGQVFAKDPEVQLPSTQMDIVEADANGGGVSLNQQARKALSHVIAHGRAGILVDYPKVEGNATKAQLDAGEIRPTITLFDPWDIINWRTITIGAKIFLSLVVISEREVTDDDGFEAKRDEYYRVLRLVEGIYHSQVWQWNQNKNGFEMIEDIIPLDASGKPWTEIPFTFVGSENNDADPDLPPLYDMAELNIAHYRNSADYEESAFMVGQPTPVLAGLTQQWVDDVLKGTVRLGSRSAIPLPEGGSATLLQAEANSMPKEGMDHKERQMVALGAKLVQQQDVQRTATEAGIEEASTSSLLATCSGNVSAAYTQALKWVAAFLGIEATDDNCVFELNKEFDIARLDSAGLQAVVAAWQAKAISFTELRGNLKSGGVAWQDDEEAKEEIASEPVDMGLPGLEPGTTQPRPGEGQQEE